MSSLNSLWVEKYRPTCVDECIIPQQLEKALKGYIKKHDMPNLLFSGSAGTCKTTTARAITNELGAETMFINASSETGKADIEAQVIPFASSMSQASDIGIPKIIIMDEAERLTKQSQDSLKSYIEQFSSNCRFIFTCNTPSMIIPPIKSRCNVYNFNNSVKDLPYMMAKMLKSCERILTEEGVRYDKSALMEFIAKKFPDLRVIVNSLQTFSTAYGEINQSILTMVTQSEPGERIFAITEDKKMSKEEKFEKVKQYVGEECRAGTEDIINSMYTALFTKVDKAKQPNYTIILSEYDYKSQFVVNKQLNLLALITEMIYA